MTGFDPHDPEIERMMHERSIAQGKALVEASGHQLNQNPERMRAVAQNADVASLEDKVDVEAMPRSHWDYWMGRGWTPQPIITSSRMQRWFSDLSGLATKQWNGLSWFVEPEPEPPWWELDVKPGTLTSLLNPELIKGTSLDIFLYDDLVAAREPKPVGLIVKRELTIPEAQKHGNKAVCPRHGVTKGGLCRRCKR